MPPIVYRTVAIVILDAPDPSPDLGPSPLLQRSSLQHDLQITVPWPSGLEHSVDIHFDDCSHIRRKVFTVPSF